MQDLLWNNICLLSRMEEKYIQEKLPNVRTMYFGMGRENDLQDFFKKEHTHWKVVVSTDTEIFCDPDLIQKQSLKTSRLDHKLNGMHENPMFKPFIVIPLVIAVNTDKTHLRPQSIEDLLKPEYKGEVVYGGPHNSAGKSLVKAIHALYGKDGTSKFFNNSFAASMPAAAYKLALSGHMPIAVVPTIFAMRQGLHGMTTVIPSEGAIAIPSYIAIHDSCDCEFEDRLNHEILENLEFHKILYQQGHVVSPLIEDSQIPLFYPSKAYFNNLNYDDLVELYDAQPKEKPKY